MQGQSPADSRETASKKVSRQRRSLESATAMLYGTVLSELLLMGNSSSFYFAATARGGAVPFSTRRKEPKTRGGRESPLPLRSAPCLCATGTRRPLDPGGCPAFPSPPTFPSALGRLVPLGSLNAGPFTGTLAILRLRKFLRIFGGTARR